MSDQWKVFFVLLAAVVLAAVGEALSAKGMKASHPDAGLVEQLKIVVKDWHVWAGVLLMIAYVFLYTYTLSLADLSFALPLSAASYAIGIFLSKYYLGEEIKLARWIGTAIVVVGVLVVATMGYSKPEGK